MKKFQNMKAGRAWKIDYAKHLSNTEILLILSTNYCTFITCQILCFVFT